MLVKLTPGVNFTHILCTALICTDPKSVKKYNQAVLIFALLRSAQVKAALKHFDEIDPS